MVKAPGERYQTPAELAAVLAPFAAAAAPSTLAETIAYVPAAQAELNTLGTGMTVPPQPVSATYPLATPYRPPASKLRKGWRRMALAGGLFAFAVVLGYLIFSGQGKEPAAPRSGWPLDNLEVTPPEKVREIDWIPEGLVVVLAWLQRPLFPVTRSAWSQAAKME
jgi:hypothetical protein